VDWRIILKEILKESYVKAWKIRQAQDWANWRVLWKSGVGYAGTKKEISWLDEE
jgi:hypothetical protein